MASWFQNIRRAKDDRDAARRERSAEVLKKLLTLPREQLFEVKVEELSELTEADRRRFIAHLSPQVRISLGLGWPAVTMITLGGITAAVAATVAGFLMVAGPKPLPGSYELALLEAAADPRIEQRAVSDHTQDELVARLSLPAEVIQLGERLARNRTEYERLERISRNSSAVEWQQAARYVSALGEDGIAFAKFATDVGFEDTTGSFISKLFAVVTSEGGPQEEGSWNGTLRKLIEALARQRDGSLAFNSEAHARVAVLEAMEKLDRRRRDVILATLGASDSDMALIARHGLPLPLNSEERATYDAIMSFRDPSRQLPSCRRGASMSSQDWADFEWTRSEEGRFARSLMENYAGKSSAETPKPCLRVYRPGTEEWRRIGAWHRTQNGQREDLTVCLIELP